MTSRQAGTRAAVVGVRGRSATRPTVARVCLTLVCLASLAACAGGVVSRRLQPLASECVAVAAPPEVADTVSVALLDEVDPRHAPRPENAAERMVFRHLYANLVEVDCRGELRGGLAESWRRMDGGRRWEFVLRMDATFWNGAAVTATDVVAGFTKALAGRMARAAGIDSVTVKGDRVLDVYFEERREGPRVLAEPTFAVAGGAAEAGWPAGTGLYRVGDKVGPGGSLVAFPVFDAAGPVLEFVAGARREARDLLEQGIDVMVSDDAAVIEYAATRRELATVALPWDRTYLLLSSTRVQALRRGESVGSLSADLLEGIARDALSGDARGHHPPGWWEDAGACSEQSRLLAGLPPVPRGAYDVSRPRRIVFASDDPVARGLAGRIVAMAVAGPGASPEAAMLAAAVPGLSAGDGGMVAQGLARAEMKSSLRDGNDFAYIIAVRRREFDACLAVRELLNRAQWLAAEGVELSRALVPLVETRRHVIVRRGAVGLVLDGDGTVRISDRTAEAR